MNKKKKGLRIVRKAEDKNTKKYILEDNYLRTIADVGREEIIRGLEFISVDKVEEKGELAEFVEVLKLLEKREDIKKVDIIIGELPEGKRAKRFSRLSDGATRRKYAIGQVIMNDGREGSLIEVEREDRALSMLMLKTYSSVNWNWIYSKLLIGLVDESGKWSNAEIDKLYKKEIKVLRVKHNKKDIYQKEISIYRKMYELFNKIII